MGKGSLRRKCQVSKEIEDANWESVFGKKKLNVMSEEERDALALENDDFRESEDDIDGLDEIDKMIKEGENN